MYRIGIDLGGTNIVAGVVDENYNIIATAKRKTAMPRPVDTILADMATVSREAVAAAGLTMDDIIAVGVGSPGTCNGETGLVETAPNLGFVNTPVRGYLEEALGKPVCVENDANAAAYGEYIAGSGKGKNSLVCITLGTGVGGGVITDDVILTGHNYAGAELGHSVIMMNGEQCSCGRRGCWEAYASATALIRQTRRAMQAHPDSKMWELSPTLEVVNGRTAFDAMRAGDAAAKEVVDNYVEYVACGVADMINIFQPEVLCIGGGISNEGESLLAPVRAAVEGQCFNVGEKKTFITTAQLGNDAGIIGAAYLYK